MLHPRCSRADRFGKSRKKWRGWREKTDVATRKTGALMSRSYRCRLASWSFPAATTSIVDSAAATAYVAGWLRGQVMGRH
nr:unnamed protein product [Digitaria exilis]